MQSKVSPDNPHLQLLDDLPAWLYTVSFDRLWLVKTRKLRFARLFLQMNGTMLRMTRFTIGKLQQCNITCSRSDTVYHLANRTSRTPRRSQLGKNGSFDVLVLPVYTGRNMSRLSCLKTGGLFLPKSMWTHSRHTVALYSTSTDSKQTSRTVVNQESKVKTSNTLPVPSEDVNKLLQLAYPQRWRLTGKSNAYVLCLLASGGSWLVLTVFWD